MHTQKTDFAKNVDERFREYLKYNTEGYDASWGEYVQAGNGRHHNLGNGMRGASVHSSH